MGEPPSSEGGEKLTIIELFPDSIVPSVGGPGVPDTVGLDIVTDIGNEGVLSPFAFIAIIDILYVSPTEKNSEKITWGFTLSAYGIASNTYPLSWFWYLIYVRGDPPFDPSVKLTVISWLPGPDVILWISGVAGIVDGVPVIVEARLSPLLLNAIKYIVYSVPFINDGSNEFGGMVSCLASLLR